MIQTSDLNTEKLRRLIDKLPPGRARRKYEVALGGLLCKEPLAGFVNGVPLSDQPSTDAALPRLKLVVTRQREVTNPIHLTPWLTVSDPGRFVEATLSDLAVYVEAENKGSRHWAKDLLEEKLRQLEKCGLKVEIEEIQ